MSLNYEEFKKVFEFSIAPLVKEINILKINQKAIIDLLLDKHFQDVENETLKLRSEQLAKEFSKKEGDGHDRT